MTSKEAAESGLYWLTSWDGVVAVFYTLPQAYHGAFYECLRRVRGTDIAEGERVPTGTTFSIFRGHKGVGEVTIRQPDPDTERHFVWSPPSSGELNDITPEEYAHLIQRRREAK
jgi:hypothetical protein